MLKFLLVSALGVFMYWCLHHDGLPYPANSTHRVVDLPEGALAVSMRLEGVLAPNVLLQRHSVRLFDGIVDGAESVVIDKDQAVVWMLDRFGNVWRAERASTPPGQAAPDSQYALEQPPFTNLGPGRPLGAALDANGDLLVCDSLKGLLKVETGTSAGSQARRITILTSRVSDSSKLDPVSPITYVNDLDVHPDGTAYFTASQNIPVGVSADGSFWDTMASYMTGLYSGAFTGRLLSYNPSTGVTEVLAKGFWFSNGVALAADASYVAFVETNRMRVMRYWLTGDKTGSVDVLIDRLPGFPDGISRAPDGSFWVALVSKPSPVLKYLRYRLVRTILSQLPPQLNIRPPAWGAAIKVDPSGTITKFLMDPDGSRVAFVSAAVEVDTDASLHGHRLFLGSLARQYVSYVDMDLLNAGDSIHTAAA